MRVSRLFAALLVVPLLAATAACGDDSASASPFGGCSSLGGAAAPNDLPDLSLPCFTGDASVSLRSLKGPAVINMWASWCGPCRAELPVMQKLSDSGKVTVIGVDTGDTRENGADFASGKGVTMPTLFDADQALLHKLDRINLPTTVFLDANGKSSVHNLPLDADTLAEQVDKLLGVKVTL
ncbi:thiol:disulfide interchange protein [Paractinoplanes deccanensis]|uniref:Thiol:disulfide interchange protein n=1 Tax=Paractinoplanes deccanensis TaxID=113561 RepID=A0ABQ3Y5F5_9ACTN|nr:TlpA disulfide reductase family protein [Actinoplanes deccanensis]GID75228.1 thiol:disulfide interchange protein [Actinoplanes deccanensis]